MAASDPLRSQPPLPADDSWSAVLRRGTVIPASPLALDADRRFDERRQRALCRYYFDAGAGGLAVGVHTTQFAIHSEDVGLLDPVLALVREEMDRADSAGGEPLVRVGGICGETAQAVREATLVRERGFHAGLLSLAALREESEDELLEHCRAVGEVIPVFGFYLQSAIGGRDLPYSFWRRFAEIESVVAVKVAAFNRYHTIDVVRAIAESGREDIALYTGNDDAIVADLLTPFRFDAGGRAVERRFVGGLLGHWAVWTEAAVDLHARCRVAAAREHVPVELLRLATAVTDMNAALFDAAHGFRGCIPGIHEVLRGQGLFEGTWCLDSGETLSPGQAAEIERVRRAYPDLVDDEFVRANLDRWLSG